MKYFLLLAFIFLFVQRADAGMTDGKVQFSLKDKILILKPDSGFHLNKDAPAKLIISSSKKTIAPEKKEKEEFNFALSEGEKDEMLLDFYVCDDKNTTCERHKLNFSINANVLVFNAQAGEKPKNITAYSAAPAVLNKHGFVVDNLEAGKKQAVNGKKLLLVDFSAPWCPACLRLETEVFGGKLFKGRTKNLVKVSLNIDESVNTEAQDKYNVTVIPTIIIMNADGIELHRIVDFRPAKELSAEIAVAVKNSNKFKSYEQYLSLADAGNKNAIRHLAIKAYERFNFKEADSWFKKINEKSLYAAAADISVSEKMTSASLVDNYKLYINAYPDSFDSIIWRNALANLKKESDEKEGVDELLKKNVSLINKALGNKELQKRMFKETAQGLFTSFEKEELYSKLIDVYNILGDKASESSSILLLQAMLSKHSLSIERTGEVLIAIEYMKQAKMKADVENWYKQLIAKNPASDLYPRKLARFYLQEQELEKALQQAQEAVKLSTHYLFWSYALLAKIQKQMKLMPEALATAEKALNMPEAKAVDNKNYVEELKQIKI
ncbi:MAG: thioredoxin domain-containing protein [Bacteriovorax sp.]|jgi:thioredoxin-like negative regulator of GroEL